MSDFRNLEAVDTLIATARQVGTELSSPFTGEERFGGQLVVLGPDKTFYEELLKQHLADERSGQKSITLSNLWRRAGDLLDGALAALPVETLTDAGETDPRNNTSAITLLQVGGHRLLFTGDAGIPALVAASSEYEARIGPFALHSLSLFPSPRAVKTMTNLAGQLDTYALRARLDPALLVVLPAALAVLLRTGETDQPKRWHRAPVRLHTVRCAPPCCSAALR